MIKRVLKTPLEFLYCLLLFYFLMLEKISKNFYSLFVCLNMVFAFAILIISEFPSRLFPETNDLK